MGKKKKQEEKRLDKEKPAGSSTKKKEEKKSAPPITSSSFLSNMRKRLDDFNRQKQKHLKKGISSAKGHVREHNNPNGPECFKCGVTCKNTGNLKNHILSHYYQDFVDVLLSAKPFICLFPGCDALPNRDKIPLARHYAFGNKKIFQMTNITPEQLGGTKKRGGWGACL